LLCTRIAKHGHVTSYRGVKIKRVYCCYVLSQS